MIARLAVFLLVASVSDLARAGDVEIPSNVVSYSSAPYVSAVVLIDATNEDSIDSHDIAGTLFGTYSDPDWASNDGYFLYRKSTSNHVVKQTTIDRVILWPSSPADAYQVVLLYTDSFGIRPCMKFGADVWGVVRHEWANGPRPDLDYNIQSTSNICAVSPCVGGPRY